MSANKTSAITIYQCGEDGQYYKTKKEMQDKYGASLYAFWEVSVKSQDDLLKLIHSVKVNSK